MWLSDGALLSSHSHHDAGVNCSELAHQASFWPSQGMFLFLCSRFLRLLPSDFTSHLPPPAPANRLRMPKIKYFTLHTVCLTVSKSKSVYSCSECPKLKVVQRACHHPPGSIPLPPKSLSKSSCLFVCLMQWVTEMEIKELVCSSKNRRLSAGRTASEPSFLHTSCYVVSEHFCSFLQHSQLAALHVAVQFSCLQPRASPQVASVRSRVKRCVIIPTVTQLSLIASPRHPQCHPAFECHHLRKKGAKCFCLTVRGTSYKLVVFKHTLSPRVHTRMQLLVE